MEKGIRHVINKNKVYEAFICEPVSSEERDNWGMSHGWQVVFVLEFLPNGKPVKRIIEFTNEKDCIDFIERLIPDQIII